MHAFKCHVKACIKLSKTIQGNQVANPGRKADGPSIVNSLARLINNDKVGVYWLMKFR
jgi:hypothetical protein